MLVHCWLSKHYSGFSNTLYSYVKSGTVMKVLSSKNRSLLDPAIKMPPRFFHWSTPTNTSVIYLLTRFLSQ